MVQRSPHHEFKGDHQMPTGYTCHIEDGTVTTLRQYALTCARAFGACASMRDEPLTVLPPSKVEPDTRYCDGPLAATRRVGANPVERASLVRDWKARRVDRPIRLRE